MAIGFSLSVAEDPSQSHGETVLSGQFRFGENVERFNCSLVYWDRARYIAQWRAALGRILAGHSESAIITSMHDPRDANYIFWWPMYADGKTVYFREHILFLSNCSPAFSEANPYFCIRPRSTDDDGKRVSEWAVSFEDIAIALEAIR